MSAGSFAVPDDGLASIRLLEIEHIDAIHNSVLFPGQLPGYKNKNDLLGAIGRPMNALYYENADLVRMAAYYWHGISTSHGYVDGNKRTGVKSATVFLSINGILFDASDDEIGPWVEKMFVEETFTLDILDERLRNHCRWL